MLKNPASKYTAFPPIRLENRQWPSRTITHAPIWMSSDLRDGNQALFEPMNGERKMRMFRTLCGVGFKQIEVGFPSASQTDFDFVRKLIEEKHIPDDVTIEVLAPAREELIRRTIEACKGARRAIVHVYNATSKPFREFVFGLSKAEVVAMAVSSVKLVRQLCDENPGTEWMLEYSPEHFTGTELDFALEVCDAVTEAWGATPSRKVILNLPTTVEMATPNVYADQIEWMHRHLARRDSVVLSLHPHNDRGTAVAAAELGLMAGADRLEGCLFGNGERTGNVDIVTIAMNMFTHGVDPKLNFSNMPQVVEAFEKATGMTVDPRHPYSGSLVFAAFSGSHQDAIAKGMKWREEMDPSRWTVPYLPVDPHDVGREYDGDVIRINSQSGKGGVAYIIERDYGFIIPKAMRAEVGYMMKDISDKHHEELSPTEIFNYFSSEYINDFKPVDITDATFRHVSSTKSEANGSVSVDMRIDINGEIFNIEAEGNGRLDAVSNGLNKTPYNFNYKFITYSEHAISADSNSKAASYVCIEDHLGNQFWGVGTHDDIILASVNALVSALNRMNKKDHFVK